MTILQLDQVNYSYSNKYQTVEVLKDLSYEFQLGKLYAIVGKSGSGKSTALSLLAGLDIPIQGQVLYKGTPTSKMDLSAYRREQVSVIYQSFRLFPLLTALENVMYPMELTGTKCTEAKNQAMELLAKVDLPKEAFNRFPAMLSGGEQQRVAIARALGTGSKIILADEPTGNLDTTNSKNIIGILKSLAVKDNYCVIIVTHDLPIANEADVVLRMSDGTFLV